MNKWKFCTVGLVGLPNHGKSTIVNALVAAKVSPVSAKEQTTRKRISGLAVEGETQFLLWDLPGWVSREDGINKFLRQEFLASLDEVDGVIWIIDSQYTDFDELNAVNEIIKKRELAAVAVLTKADLGAPSVDLLEWLREREYKVLVGSAKKQGPLFRNQILQAIQGWSYDTDGPVHDPDYVTLEPLRTLASELVREQCFEHLSQEVPYQLAVQIRAYEELPTLHRIFAEIIVARESHKPIVIGTGGERIKAIGTAARKNIEALVGQKVFLDLRVRVVEGWMGNKQWLKELGYDRSK